LKVIYNYLIEAQVLRYNKAWDHIQDKEEDTVQQLVEEDILRDSMDYMEANPKGR